MAVQQHRLWFGPPLQSFNMKTLEDTSSLNAFVSRTADSTTMYQSWTWLTTYLIIVLHQRRFSTSNSRMYTESRHSLMDSKLLLYLPSVWGRTHLILCRMPFLMQPSQLAGLESSTGSTPAWNQTGFMKTPTDSFHGVLLTQCGRLMSTESLSVMKCVYK